MADTTAPTLTDAETPEQAAERCYNHGGYHADAAGTEDAMRAFCNGARWALAAERARTAEVLADVDERVERLEDVADRFDVLGGSRALARRARDKADGLRVARRLLAQRGGTS